METCSKTLELYTRIVKKMETSLKNRKIPRRIRKNQRKTKRIRKKKKIKKKIKRSYRETIKVAIEKNMVKLKN